MGKFVYLMGKSASGKDTIFKELVNDPELDLKQVVPYTTRPIREGEKNGVEYFFIDEACVEELEREKRIIELRAYHTVHGIWKYLTVDDEQFDFSKNSLIMIGTFESYLKTKEYFGEDRMLPILIDVEDGLRLERALARERQQKEPKYRELCRRFLADAEDFSQEKEALLGEIKHIENTDFSICVDEVKAYVRKNLSKER